MLGERQIIFISHAVGKDTFFAVWLACKLRLLGYDTWVDSKNIHAGDYYWRNIQNLIQTKSARFIPVMSNEYISRAAIDDSGVMNEIAFMRGVRDVNNFVLPVRIDASDYSNFPVGIVGRDCIDFQNWSIGLCKLVDELVEKKVSQSLNPDINVIRLWFDAKKIQNELIERPEQYRTNWFECILPQKIYVYSATKEKGAVPTFSFAHYSDGIVSFTAPDKIRDSLIFTRIDVLDTFEFIENGFHGHSKLIRQHDSKRLVIQLMNSTLSNFLDSIGMVKLPIRRQDSFFFPITEDNEKIISLRRYGKSRRQVMGNSRESMWVFGISFNPVLFPSPMYRIFYHMKFYDSNLQILPDDQQHQLRRSFPKDWYNRRWYETLLAAMLRIYEISNGTNDLILIPVSNSDSLKIRITPFKLDAPKGYNEPTIEKNETDLS